MNGVHERDSLKEPLLPQSAELHEALAQATAAVQQYRVIAFRVIEEFEAGLQEFLRAHGFHCNLVPPHRPRLECLEEVRANYRASDAVCFREQALVFNLRLADSRRWPARVREFPFRIHTTPSGWVIESDACALIHDIGSPTLSSRLDYAPVYGKIGDCLLKA